jgi:type IV pilus assembly protein PilV
MKPSAIHKQRGVGLVEVLIAVLVLSIGLLGLAGLQLRTLRNNQSSLERGMAVAQTHFIVDAMRADRANAIELATSFNISLTAVNPTGPLFRQVAIRRWRENLVAALGTGATGSINCNGALCDIVVQWNDQRGSQGSTAEETAAATHQVTTQVQL